ncbi:MAG TPA: hypothetical protein PKC96_05725 [Bacilli bacterium]|jgi:hypothetical protein|nr:hypothetical protein [Bacilli bacterium]HMM00823.1 hypothetical protein [Bacilli bacterium]
MNIKLKHPWLKLLALIGVIILISYSITACQMVNSHSDKSLQNTMWQATNNSFILRFDSVQGTLIDKDEIKMTPFTFSEDSGYATVSFNDKEWQLDRLTESKLYCLTQNIIYEKI